MSNINSISMQMDSNQVRFNESKTSAFNAELKAQGQEVNKPLGQADFFKILSVQLANQDPLKPMEDKEFIAQMAQFQSLEQAKNMSSSMGELTDLLKQNAQSSLFTGAVNLLGREATVRSEKGAISGRIEQLMGNENPQVRIGQDFYNISDILQIQ